MADKKHFEQMIPFRNKRYQNQFATGNYTSIQYHQILLRVY